MSNKVGKISKQAWNRIASEGLPPTPQIYELWYVYYCESDQDVLRAMEKLLAEEDQISEGHCLTIYNQFLSHTRYDQEVRKASDSVQQAIEDAKTVVDEVKISTHEYSEDIKAHTRVLLTETDPITVRKVLDDVVSTTDNMVKKNEELERQLLSSAEMMEEMRRNMEEAQKEARTDALTGVANRKAFEQTMQALVEDFAKNQSGFCLIMMDIDHFKNFNDNYGHQIGDQVIKLVAQTLFDGIKGRDVVCRYGGEEFAVILPETGMQGGLKVAEMLRMDVASKDLVNRTTGEKLGTITLSGGVAEYRDEESVDDIVERADAALYKAKHNGRNQIAAASQ